MDNNTRKLSAGISLLTSTFLLATCIAAYIGLNRVEQNLKLQATSNLKTVMQNADHSIFNLWMDDLIEDAQMWAKDPVTIKNTLQLLDIQKSATLLAEHPAQKELFSHYSHFREHQNISDVLIISPSYTNILTSNKFGLGQQNPINKWWSKRLAKAFSGIPQFIPPMRSGSLSDKKINKKTENKNVSMFILAPIRDKENNVIAVFATQLDPADKFSLLAQNGRIGTTGETYLIDSKGNMLTKSRFHSDVVNIGLINKDEKCILNVQVRDPGTDITGLSKQFGDIDENPLTYMASHISRGESGSSTVAYRDYRGVPVFGAWHWNEKYGIGIATEIDEVEAMSVYYDTQSTILFIIAFVVASALLFLFFVFYLIKNPVNEIKNSESYLQAIMGNAFNGIITMGEDGLIQKFNTEAEIMFGYKEAEVTGENVSMLMPEPYKKEHDGYLKKYLDTDVVIFSRKIRDIKGMDSTGREFDIELGLTETQHNNKKLFIGTVQDISQRKEIEAALLRSNEELRSFAYVASHDLQEPLRMVTSYLQLIERRYNDKLDDDGREFIKYAVDGSARMQLLIQSLLAYSRVSTHGNELVPVNTGDVFEKVMSNLMVAVNENDAEVNIPDNCPALCGDEIQLVQLFQNLIGNALKFTRDKKPVINLKIAPIDNTNYCDEMSGLKQGWLFSVEDNGIGIEKEYWERIFKIFQRLHGNSEFKGTGIGLSICQKIVSRHHGKIWLYSEPGAGTTFYIAFPGNRITDAE